VAVSFVIVTALYLGIALAVQLTLPADDSRLASTPVATLLEAALGPAAGRAVAVLSLVAIAANLIGACWAASRLVFASAREGLLPARLSEVHERSHVPRAAVAATVSAFALVAVLHFVGVVSLGALLQAAGQNFFLLYGISVVAYVRLVSHRAARAFGIASLALVAATLGTFGWGLIYPAALLLAGLALFHARAAGARRAATGTA